MDLQKFGLIVNSARQRAKLTQEALAEQISNQTGLSFSQPRIAHWCQGKNLPNDRETLLMLCQALYATGGLTSLQEINSVLLPAGGGALHQSEIKEWFPALLANETTEERVENTYPPRTTTKKPEEMGSSNQPAVNQTPINRVSPSTTLPVFGNVPPPPALVVGREDALSELKVRLGITPSDKISASLQVLTAVRGWPGVGKTTLAAVLAHEPDIAEAFPDGVLWTSLGQRPNLLSELAAWGRELGNKDILRARDEEEASKLLRGLLYNKRMLLIVDDVWEPAHGKLFDVGGRGCAMLITTRIPHVAQMLAPTPNNIYKLAVLSNEKAMELLQILAPKVVAQYPEQSLELVKELEGLPLALQVAGRLLYVEASYGFNVVQLINELREGAELIKAKAPADRTDLATQTIPTVAALLERSTKSLSDHVRDSFAYLGAFAPKPATFDLAAMKAVWLLPDPKPITRELVNRGLLEPVGGRFQMHALLVVHARSFLT